MQFQTTINCSREEVFALIADLANYPRWLPPSNLYDSVTSISNLPVQRGTTYVDRGQSTIMNGEVTEFELPHVIAFHQLTTIQRVVPLGGIDIRIRYTLTDQGQGTQVNRAVTLQTSGLLRVAQPIIVNTTRRENERILQMMKTHLESHNHS
jgi:uncharacterized protein YndB with AHSA1/START domain